MWIALIVGIATVTTTAVFGAVCSKKEFGKTIIAGVLGGAIYGLILSCVYYFGAIGFYGPTPVFWSVVIGCIIGGFIGTLTNHEDTAGCAGGALGIILLLVWGLWIVITGTWDATNAKQKAGLIGEVKVIEGNLAEVITPSDNAHILQVPPERAFKAAQTALSKFKMPNNVVPGSRYEIGEEPTIQFVNQHLWYIYPVEFQGWKTWRRDPQVPGFLRVSAEDPYKEGQAVQHNAQGEEIHIKYVNSACWGYKAKRKLRAEGYRFTILEDWTFEVDDNWNPYYTVSTIERKHGWSARQVTGIVAFNLVTGEHEHHSIDELPKWVDRAMPIDVLESNIKKWGWYRNADWMYTIWQSDKSQQPTKGWYMVYDHKSQRTKWYSGFTSMESDLALTGFIVSDTCTGETTFYSTQGVTENEIYQAGNALWPESPGVLPALFVPYNIHGRLTYIMPMCQESQMIGYSVADITNTLKAKGTTVEEALDNYAQKIATAGQDQHIPGAMPAKILHLTRRIVSVNLLSLTNGQAVYGFRLEGISKIFRTSYSLRNPEVAAIAPDEMVKVSYPETREKVITVSTFDIISLELRAEHPEQARYEAAKPITDEEVDRVQKVQDVETMLRGVDPSRIDPEKLKQLLQEQNN